MVGTTRYLSSLDHCSGSSVAHDRAVRIDGKSDRVQLCHHGSRRRHPPRRRRAATPIPPAWSPRARARTPPPAAAARRQPQPIVLDDWPARQPLPADAVPAVDVHRAKGILVDAIRDGDAQSGLGDRIAPGIDGVDGAKHLQIRGEGSRGGLGIARGLLLESRREGSTSSLMGMFLDVAPAGTTTSMPSPA